MTDATPARRWIDTLTPEEKAAILAKMGPPKPWETEGGIASSPDPVAEAHRARYRRRKFKRAEEESNVS